ncbi:hypothetical protein F5B22DRAFT_643675 [Xylaria bambusicola]|uniref:uncharacterized protein n=1 Tax=Xylaria bambusicola TaxID=326684 RepID=UPI002008B9A1|nr:uncharacterized protein F5B22DRAFT_643675 [Xylaria bambusicola]KAI0521509.1 hypothetical protein F5B22DRAFT_643675 [Xylaria bambusicola]
MDYDTHGHPAAPAGDIGNHVIPKVVVYLAGIIGLLAVTVRLYARYAIKKLGIPDALLVISMGFFIVILYNGYQGGIYPGLGVHNWQFNPELATTSHFDYKLATISFGLGIAFLKVAILLDWVNIFVPTGTRNSLFWILQFLIWSNALFYFIGSFIDGLICQQKNLVTAKCGAKLMKYIVASGVVNLVSDLIILITPHWVIWKLNMSTTQKKGISLLFVIGLLAIGSALARLISVINAYHKRDMLYYAVMVNILAILEQTFGFLVIGVPAIPKAFHNSRWAKRFGTLLPRSKQPSNSIYHREQGTWPVSGRRRHQDPWDTDTRALVIGDEDEDIALPEQTHIQHGRRNCSKDELGINA